jgi:hypothetical protein
MNLRDFPAVSWLTLLGALAAAPAALAQQQGAPSSVPARDSQSASTKAMSPGAKSVRGEAMPSVSYRSAFESYRRYAEEAVRPWAKSNEVVGQIGGWKAYAREAAGEAEPSSEGGATPVSIPAGAAVTQPASTPAGHQGHKK